MSQKPLTFLVSLFGADQSLLTKHCVFGRGTSRGQLYWGVGTGGGGRNVYMCLCNVCVCVCLCNGKGGCGGHDKEEPWC